MNARNSAAVAVLFVLFFTAAQASAELFRWMDKDGQEFFTNERAKVPLEYRTTATEITTNDNRVSVAEKHATPGGPSVAVKEHKDRYGHGEEWWQRRAENLRLEQRNLEDDYEVLLKQEQDREKNPKTKKRTGSKKSVSSHDRKKLSLEKKMAQVKRRLEVDLPEEARKADAYPGWIR